MWEVEVHKAGLQKINRNNFEPRDYTKCWFYPKQNWHLYLHKTVQEIIATKDKEQEVTVL